MVAFCPICGKPVYFGEKKRSLGRDYHPLCLKCFRCKSQLSPGNHAEELDSQYLTRLLGQLLKEFQQTARKDCLLSPEDSLQRLHSTAEQPVRKIDR
ncbi:cysteine-rich protein 3 isoform X1 [Polyodon spathula]|uniref:cysteine-rich protein 3 isoform X1 n=1 Tax=Polyodon spathula TaxID=7913 RepID=UPI001B7EBF43|nr:cysteine-rich protein 3 isoform X1 [Polyodon spathula]